MSTAPSSNRSEEAVLFVMMSSTAEAEDVADYLRVKYPAELAE